MKTFVLFSLIAATFAFSGCVKRFLKYTTTMDLSGTMHIDQSGGFSTSSSLNATLNIPSDAKVTDISIESLSLVPRILTGHTAQTVNAGGNVITSSGSTPLFPAQNLTLTGIEFIPDAVIAAGVEKLKGIVTDYMANHNIPTTTYITISGTVFGGRALFDIDYHIKATVKYGRCEEMPSFWNIGDDCPDNNVGF
jgi:hypothetical protein